ncbi:MAG TPA: malto-oligosyltrehalose trehalohydrolase [Verrucomicrobiae bacterium]|jgi:maltooligosyltrehalose trehalohydrolase
MQSIRVWAPAPKKVELAVQEKRIPMERQDGGWWAAELTTLDAGGDYGFVLDGEGPFPDPRSPCQPNGVDGLSRPVTHKNFVWTDTAWQAPPISSAIIYELHIGTFTPAGTFKAAMEKLDHLVDLGITHVELMPVNEFSGGHGWGYDGVDLFAPHHACGTPEDLKRLVEACHLKRLAVILDVVYNHFGPVGNYWAKFGPYAKDNFSTPWGAAINFDSEHSDEVRRFFCDNALMWLRDYHFDGLRLDALHAIVDISAEPFLAQLAGEVKKLEAQLGRHLALIAESDRNDPRLLWSHGRGGFALHAHWNDDFHHALHTALTGEKDQYYVDFNGLPDLCKSLQKAYIYDGQFSPFRKRRQGRVPEGLDGSRFVVFSQNHDQVGNRAFGERNTSLMNSRRLKIAAALVLASPFLPMLFQGEEWGASTPFLYFSDHRDPVMAAMVREGRCREFPSKAPSKIPDPQAPETFTRSKLAWDEISQPRHAELLDWHKQLIRLRRSNPSLCDGRMEDVRARCDERQKWLILIRGIWTVACNLGEAPVEINLREGAHEIVASSEAGIVLAPPKITLPPESVAVLKESVAG